MHMIQLKNRFLFTPLLVFCLSVTYAQQTVTPTVTVGVDSKKWAGPDILFGKLFVDVQLKAVFPDSKTFADCTPKFPATTILANYDKARLQKGFRFEGVCAG